MSIDSVLINVLSEILNSVRDQTLEIQRLKDDLKMQGKLFEIFFEKKINKDYLPGWEPNVWHDIALLSADMEAIYRKIFLFDDGDFSIASWNFTEDSYKKVYKKYMLPIIPEEN